MTREEMLMLAFGLGMIVGMWISTAVVAFALVKHDRKREIRRMHNARKGQE